MSRSFEGFGALALHLVEVEVGMYEALHSGLERVAHKIEAAAKTEIGVYQPAVGPFPAWLPLADVTLDRKAADTPLLETGSLQDSIQHETEGLEAVIGTTDEIGAYQEFGTSRGIPPRPFMGPAAFKNKAAIEKMVGAAVVAGFVGEDVVHEALGYDMETSD